MIEVRLHGRGGQGVVMAATILGEALVIEGKYAASFPMFGAERRGAPVTAFVRFGDQFVRERTQIYHPDWLIVLDPQQAGSPLVYNGLKAGGVLVLNSSRLLEEAPNENVKTVVAVDATTIALKEIGIAVPNSCMLGAFAGGTKAVSLSSVFKALEHYFSGKALDRNRRAAERGYEEIHVTEW